MKNYFNLLFSVILLVLFSCREEILESQNEHTHNHENTSYLKNHTQYFDFVAHTNLNFSPTLSIEVKGNNTLILDTIITNNFFVNVEDIMFTANKSNQPTSYSFYIAPKESKGDVFHNLVFMKKKTGGWIYRLLKYTPNENSKPNHFQGSIEELFDSEKVSDKTNSNKITCYYQILSSGGTCSSGHKTLSDCGGNVNCCANCWMIYQTAMLNCDQEGLEYPSDGGGFGINDGGGFPTGGSTLIFALDANYRTKFNTLSQEIKLHLVQTYESNLDIVFSNWSIDFFVQNPTTTWEQFQSWFLNPDADQNILNEVRSYLTETGYALPTYNINSYPGKEDNMPFEWWNDENWMKNNIRIDANKPNEAPNSTELILFSLYKYQAVFHIKNSNNALSTANQLANSGKYTHIHNGKADAFRHTFWNALDSADFGKKITLLFTTAHEVGSSNHPLETQMDLHNNEQGASLGINYGTFTPANTIKDAVISMIDSTSSIWYLTPLADHDGNNILSTTQIKPTN